MADYLASVLADVRENWPIYAAMPFAGALIGYVTKVLAIRMMFQPLIFRGLGPYLGWQGVVPRHAARMAAAACDLLLQRLIDPREVIERLDPDRIAEELEKPLHEAVDDITHEVMTEYYPGLWESLPEAMRRLLIRRIQAEAPQVVAEMMSEVRQDLHSFVDLKAMVVTHLVRDRALLNRIFQESGHAEFRFIARSGIYFGFTIGCLQMLAWALTRNPLVLPLFGLITGWLTDWIALKLVFYPKRPWGIGRLRWQGLLLQRRQEVTAQYGELIAQEILTPAHLFKAVLTGPLSDRVFVMVHRHIQRAVDSQTGLARPLVVFAVGSAGYEQLKMSAAQRVMDRLPATMRFVEGYATDALDIRNTLVAKMQKLDAAEFEELIRPAFRQDEWILIAVGAALGFGMGELQVFLLLH